MTERIAVIGLGYVGLPVAMAFAQRFPQVIGFDIDDTKICELRKGFDRTEQFPETDLLTAKLHFTSEPDDLKGATFFIVAVPTPVDTDNRPDLAALKSASRIVGKALQTGAVVVYEFDGLSRCDGGGLRAGAGERLRPASGADFKLGYSPERINPGDMEHTFEKIKKVVSGEDAETLERVAARLRPSSTAGVHRAPSIKVAEAAKVIENTQRDLNIALMNELALIFDRSASRTRDVLAAAGTKWNFLPFTPGLVGGHCIGVDPYYLTAKGAAVGYHPEVILAGRRINDGMGRFIAQRLVKLRSIRRSLYRARRASASWA